MAKRGEDDHKKDEQDKKHGLNIHDKDMDNDKIDDDDKKKEY